MYFLAIDIGASSGRHILGTIKDNKIILEEVHRFDNGFINKNSKEVWDIEYLFSQVVEGLKKCKELDKIPMSVGIDTWGVDFVLLDENDNLVGDSVSYRDSRTTGIKDKIYEVIPKNILYEKTGIQEQDYNTIFQLKYLKDNTDEIQKAESFLMLPDYLNFLLTGVKKQEYTNATTTSMVNAYTKEWDSEIIEKLGFKKSLFKELSTPGTKVGTLSNTIQNIVGFNCHVILPCTHDTASAIAALPDYNSKGVYISSGTWSLMGIESTSPIITAKTQEFNLSNEGGINYQYRFLKNIMGLWIIQNVKNELGNITYGTLCDLAETSNIRSIVDCNDNVFFTPKSMITEIKNYCEKTNQEIPTEIKDIAAVVYNSLAYSYSVTVKEIEDITKKDYKAIYIIGGGSNAAYLNKLTAKYSKKKVFAKPSEATAIGNLLVQMIENKVFNNLIDARKCVYNSFNIEEY
ncbi:MAG: rhamnulokinase [Lachnospirales bacterium]